MPRPPFLVLALPRSRTAWLSHYLSHGPDRCGHDEIIDCKTLPEFIDRFHGSARLAGSCETGAVDGWRAILAGMPKVRLLLVRRPPLAVWGSLAKFGIAPPTQMLEARNEMLNAVAAVPGVTQVRFSDLNDEQCCRWIFEHLLEKDWDRSHWLRMRDFNIQVDMPRRIAKLQRCHADLEVLKDSVREACQKVDGGARMSRAQLTIRQESWADVWPEIDPLFARHFGEVGDGGDTRRPYKLDVPLMEALDAHDMLLICAVRRDDLLVGYCMWNLSPDAESAGELLATHGPWFVLPGHYGAARKVFEFSLRRLYDRGIVRVFPHHRLAGRGQGLGRYYERLGAKPIQHTYALNLKDLPYG